MKVKSKVHRKGFGLKEQIAEDLSKIYQSQLVQYISANGNKLQINGLAIHLAKQFGFCYGVERAIEYVYETKQKFLDRKIYLLGEIVHNPFVNKQIRKMGIEIVDGLDQEKNDFHFVQSNDVVILPAFGVTHSTFLKLKERGCEIIDTTCGSVLTVWKQVEEYAQNGFTTLIHGKFSHEETIGICSQISKYPNGKYIIIGDKKEASLICDFIDGNISANDFMKHFSKKTSIGFNPKNDLQKIGLANQTTMLGSDSVEIGKIVETSLKKKWGEKELANNFRNFDSICSATQDRQDALKELLKSTDLDFMLIIGGFKSSNTANLVKISTSQLTTYHIQDVNDLRNEEEIRHKLSKNGEVVISKNWFSQKNIQIGITAGASTPNSKIGQVIYRLFELKSVSTSKLEKLLKLT